VPSRRGSSENSRVMVSKASVQVAWCRVTALLVPRKMEASDPKILMGTTVPTGKGPATMKKSSRI